MTRNTPSPPGSPLPPRTTTSVPPTSTSTTAPTTTTVPVTTTTVPAGTSSGGTPTWVWVVVGIAVLAAVAAVAALIVRRRGTARAMLAWRPVATHALEGGRDALAALRAAPTEPPGTIEWAMLETRAGGARDALEEAASSAPTPAARDAAGTAAQAVGGLTSAVGAELLLRASPSATGEQLADAAAATADRAGALDAALQGLATTLPPTTPAG